MASFGFTMSEELQKELSEHLSRVDEVAPKMLEEAAPILVKALKHYAPTSIKKASNTVRASKLKNNIKAKKPKKTKNGAWILPIVFTGKEIRKTSDGKYYDVTNAQKAVYAEYGKSDQEANPFIRPAIEDCEDDVNVEMQAVFFREMMK